MRKFFIKAELTADENEEGRITGYASVYGNIDSYSEVIDKGAFSEILADVIEAQTDSRFIHQILVHPFCSGTVHAAFFEQMHP